MYSSLLKITRLFGHLWGAILLHAISKHRHLVIYPALKALFSLADQTLGTSVAVAVLIWRMFFVQHMRSTNLFSLLLVRKNISLGELPLPYYFFHRLYSNSSSNRVRYRPWI